MKSLKLKIKKVEEHGKGLFWTLAGALLLVTAFYVYLVNTAAMNGVRWSRADKDITAIGATISELESRYLSLKQSVTLSLAYAKGFEDVKNVTFISAQKVGAVATANEI